MPEVLTDTPAEEAEVLLPAKPPRSNDPWLLLALFAAAIGLRLPGLGASFYGDEVYSLLRDSNAWLTPYQDRFRPLYFALLFGWKQLGFHGEAGLRSLSLVFGVLQIPAAHAIGRRLGGSKVGLSFALLLTIDPILIEFSQELRMYSFVSLVALVQAWAFTVVVARSRERRPALGPWLGFVLAGVAGVYAHIHYWLLLVGFAFAIGRRRRELRLKHGVAAMMAVALAYLPNVPNVLRFQREAGEQAHLLATDLPSSLPKLLAAFLVGFSYFHVPDLGLSRAIRLSALEPNLGLGILLALPALVVGWRVVQRCASRDPGSLIWLSVELFVVPVLVSFVAVAATGRNFIHPKYMVFSAPFLMLSIVAGYKDLPARWMQAVVAVSGASVFLAAYAHLQEPQEFGRREDWRGAATLLRPLLGESSELLLLAATPAAAAPAPDAVPTSLWEYYASDLSARTRSIRLPRRDVTPEEYAPIARQLVQGKRDVYYLWSETERNFDDPRDVVLAAARSIWTDEERRQLDPRLVLYHWHAN